VSSTPAIKGSVSGVVVERVAKLVERGELSREALARRLDPGDLELLDQPVSVSGWYDIRAYVRLNGVLLDVEGGGHPEYYREQGRHTAQRLIDAGLYAQMEYLNRAPVMRHTDPAERFRAFGRDLRLLASLSGSILDFTCWTALVDPEREHRYLLEVSQAAEMPESLCWRSDGFVNGMAAAHGQGDLWSWTRPRRDLVLFRMQRDA